MPVPEQIPRSRYRDRYERKRATRLLIFPASNITEQPSDFRAAMQHILFAAAKNYFQTVMLHSLCHLASRALVRKIDTFEIVSLDVQRERAMLWWQRRMLIRVLANHVVAAPAEGNWWKFQRNEEPKNRNSRAQARFLREM